MWFLWIVCGLVVVLLCYSWVWMALCRHSAVKRLHHTVRCAGGRMRPLHRMVALSRNRSPHYDLLIEKGNTLYAVKLWSAKRRGVDLLISSDGLVAEERVDRDPLSPKRQIRERVIRSPFRPVSKTQIRFPVPEGKEVVRILLIYPSYRCVRGYHHMQWVELQSGDRVFDKLLYAPSAFEKLLLEK